jgi:hypothetical protein
MASEIQKRSRLIIFFVIGTVLFNYPILSLFSDEKKEIFGIPLLFAFVFSTWAVLICLTFITVNIRRKQDSHHSNQMP